MPALAPSSVDALLDLIRRSNILTPERLAALPGPGALPPDAPAAADELLKRGFITKFQREQLLLGRHKGFRIGPYVIREQLGRGGMGAVYLAEHLDLHRRVAVKILAPGKGEDQKLALERFLREARASASLDHPNIVRIFDVARAAQTPYIVMEYVDGETLQHAVDREGPLPYAVAAEYVAQAASGLQHAHEKGLVHRDIKPANLMRDRTGVIKLLDLGLARTDSARDKLTEVLDEGAVVGTADYISPEQAMNGTVDCRADIYSLGATFFTLVTGKVPFEGNTTQKLMQHQMRVPAPLHEVMPDIPRELSAVVSRMLAKKAADRFQSAAEVIAALAPWAAASTRVLAGLSSTALGNPVSGTDLSGRAASSSRRLLARTSSGDVSLGAPADGEVPTIALTGSDTSKNKAAPQFELARPKSRKRLVVALGVATLAAVAVLIGLALSDGKKDETAQPVPPVQPPQPKSKVEPKPKQPPAKVLFAADFAQVKPFAARYGWSDPNGTGKRAPQRLSRTGDGDLPAGWTAHTWKDGGEMEVRAEVRDGKPALGFRNVGETSAMLFAPKFDCPTGACTVRVEYSCAVHNMYSVRFKPNDERAAWDVGGLQGSAEWRAHEMPVDMKGATGGTIEVHNWSPDSVLWLRAFTLTEAATPTERVLFATDFSKLQPFTVRSGLTPDPKDASKNQYKLISKTGPGALPAGWDARCSNLAGEMEVFGETAPARALGVRNLRIGSAILFAPKVECPSGLCRVRLEYMADMKPKSFVLRFKPETGPVWIVATPAVGGTQWRTFDALVDLKGAKNGVFELHNGDSAGVLRVRLLQVVEPSGPASGPAREVFKFDAADLPDFQFTKTGTAKTGGDEPPNVTNVFLGGWKPETESAWAGGQVAGSKAVSFTNLNTVLSAQIALELERTREPIAAGSAVRARVEYRTAGAGRGYMYFQNVGARTVHTGVDLPASPNEWNAVELVVTRDVHPLRLLVDASTTGAGNTLIVRKVLVTTAGGASAPGALSALDFGTVQPATFDISMTAPGRRNPTGAGAPPMGWWVSHTGGSEGEARYESRAEDGRAVIGLRKTTGKGGVQLVGPLGPPMLAGGAYELVVEYRTGANFAGHVEVRRKFDEWTNVPHVLRLEPTDGKWARKTLRMEPAQDWPTLFVVQNTSKQLTGNEFDVRLLEIVPLGAPAAVAPKAEPESPFANFTEGASLYKFDAATVPVFRNTKEQWMRASGDEEKLPAGVDSHCWKAGATGEFRRDTFDGAAALGVTNLSDLGSAQFVFNLEKQLGVALEPGKAYRLKATYRTANEANGALVMHVVPEFKVAGKAPLAGAGKEWKTAAADFTRPPASDNVTLRFVIDNYAVGEGNTIWVKSVEVVELLPPKK